MRTVGVRGALMGLILSSAAADAAASEPVADAAASEPCKSAIVVRQYKACLPEEIYNSAESPSCGAKVYKFCWLPPSIHVELTDEQFFEGNPKATTGPLLGQEAQDTCQSDLDKNATVLLVSAKRKLAQKAIEIIKRDWANASATVDQDKAIYSIVGIIYQPRYNIDGRLVIEPPGDRLSTFRCIFYARSE
jgi:hypothetical protein